MLATCVHVISHQKKIVYALCRKIRIFILYTSGRCTASVPDFHAHWPNAVPTLTLHAGGQPHQFTIFFSLVVSLIVSACVLQISMC